MNQIKRELEKLSAGDLNSMLVFIEQLKVSKQNFHVNQPVWIVQKTKRTSAVITKVNKTRCIVRQDNGGAFNVPMSMLEAK